MQHISLYGFWWVFGTDLFKFKRRNVRDFPHIAQPEDDSQLRSQTHVAQSHDAPRPVLGEFRGDVFLKRSKKALQDSWGGGLVKLSDMSWYSIDMSWYFMIFQDIVPWQFCWNSWMFDDILLLYICLKLLDVLLVTLSWNLSTVPSGVSPGALETSKQHRKKRKYSAWCRHLHIYI